MKKIFTIISLIAFIMPVSAFEDCIISNDAKLTDITIEHNDIIDVFPLITLMNEKNTLIVHPMKVGSTRFGVLKNGKEKVIFNVNVTENETLIEPVEGFEILSIDCPPGYFEYEYELDEPPEVK